MQDTSATTRQNPASRPDGRRRPALALLCTVNFMVILDAQIVLLALPSIQDQLRMSSTGGQWVMSAYLLAFGGLLLLGGRLADLVGRRRVFLMGTGLFLVSSLLCGFAWSAGVLIAARVGQGISAAVMAPAALAILMTTFDEGRERNRALAVWSGTGGVGATAALVIGGTLTGSVGWEWIFFLNVPVAIGMLVLGPVLLRESRERDRTTSYDPIGAIAITGALVLLVGAIVQAPVAGWTSLPTIGLFAGFAGLLGVFVAVERRSAAPLVPLRIFRSKAFAGGNLVMALIAMAAWGMGYSASGFAQQVLDYSPLRFGLGMAAMTAMTLIGAYAAQAGIARVGLRAVAMTGAVLIGTGSLLLTGISPTGGYFTELLPGLVVFGLGLGGGPVAAAAAALSGVGEREAGVASGVNTAAFQLGGAIGTAIVSTVVVAYASGGTSDGRTDGFAAGFATCVVLAVVALCAAVVLLKQRRP